MFTLGKCGPGQRIQVLITGQMRDLELDESMYGEEMLVDEFWLVYFGRPGRGRGSTYESRGDAEI
jgi:hypothetical protein